MFTHALFYPTPPLANLVPFPRPVLLEVSRPTTIESLSTASSFSIGYSISPPAGLFLSRLSVYTVSVDFERRRGVILKVQRRELIVTLAFFAFQQPL